MNAKQTMLWSAAAALLMAAGSLYVFHQLPADAMLPSNYGLDGRADRHAPAWIVLSVLPALVLVIGALFAFLPKLDPRQGHALASSPLWQAALIAVLCSLALVHAGILEVALNPQRAKTNEGLLSIIPAAMGVLLIVIGNYMPKSRPNWFAGVRTPWTLSSDHSWQVTHRWGGMLFVLAGLCVIAAWLALGFEAGIIALAAGSLAAGVISVVISYFAWRADPARAPTQETAP